MTNALTALCQDNECRSTVQSAQQQTLGQIDRVDSQTYCQRYGYCASETPFYMSRVLANHIGSDIEAINDRLEAAITSDICFQHGQLRPMCEHLMASKDGHRFGYVYLALLKNNRKVIDDDLREQMQTKPNADVCQSCKNAVQSGKDFWKNSLVRLIETPRLVLSPTSSRSPFVMFSFVHVNVVLSKINAVISIRSNSMLLNLTSTVLMQINSVNPFIFVRAQQ